MEAQVFGGIRCLEENGKLEKRLTGGRMQNGKLEKRLTGGRMKHASGRTQNARNACDWKTLS